MNRLKFLKSLALIPFLGWVIPNLKAEPNVVPQPTMLDRVGIRRLIVNIKRFMTQLADSMWMGDDGTQYCVSLRRYLDSLVSRGALQSYTVYCFEECFLGGPKKCNRIHVMVNIQPINTVEWIVLDSIISM